MRLRTHQIAPDGASAGDVIAFDGANWLATPSGLFGAAAPDEAYVPIPELVSGTQSTRTAQTTCEGASYLLTRACTFDRVIVRVTGKTGTPTGKVLIYQQIAGKGIGTLYLVATCTLVATATGTYELEPAEGSVTLVPGVCFILFGRLSTAGGSLTMRTFSNVSRDLCNLNVPAGCYPQTFTTAIATTSSPSLIISPTALIPENGSNTGLIVRFRTVGP